MNHTHLGSWFIFSHGEDHRCTEIYFLLENSPTVKTLYKKSKVILFTTIYNNFAFGHFAHLILPRTYFIDRNFPLKTTGGEGGGRQIINSDTIS